jgi:hypothetical protein
MMLLWGKKRVDIVWFSLNNWMRVKMDHPFYEEAIQKKSIGRNSVLTK